MADDGYEVGKASVRITPDTTGFAEQLQADVDKATAGAGAKVPISADDEELKAKVDDARAKLDELAGEPTTVKLAAGDEAGPVLDDLKAKKDEAARPVTIPVGADDEAGPVLDDVKGKKDTLGEPVTVPVGADGEDAEATIAELRLELSRLTLQSKGIPIDADASKADVTIATLQAKVDALRAKPVPIDADDASAKAKIGEDKAELDELDAKTARPRVTLEDGEFKARLGEDKAELDEASASSGSFSMPGLPSRGGLLGGLAAGLAGLSPGLAGAATGLGLLGGTGALAFGGITKALGAAYQSSQSVGQTSAQTAATTYQNAVQVQQAQEAVGQAHRQAAEDAVTSAASIEQAEMNVASVERNSAASQIQALQSVQQAQQGVQTATSALSEANYNLGQAYVQAREQIVSLNDALADSRLSVQSASLAVAQAEHNLTLVSQNAFSTDLDRQQASLAVAQAKQQLKDSTDQEADAQTAANLASKQGVDGSQTVIQAKNAQVAAQYGMVNATQQLQDAQRNLTDTELNNAQQEKQAQLELTQARQQAAYQAQQDSIAIANAEQNVTQTIREQQLQLAATQSTANQAASQFAKDMAALTPAGRAVVDQILGMKGAFKQLEGTAENTVLPGIVTFLKGISSLLPVVNQGVGQMGGAISKAFGEFGKKMETPQFAKVLQGLISNGMEFANTVLPAIAGTIQELATVGSQPGAESGLAGLLAGIANGLTGIESGLAPFTSGLSSFFSGLGQALGDLGGPLGQVIGALGSALAPVIQGLLPGFRTLVDTMGTRLAAALLAASPLLGAVAQAVSSIIIALAPSQPALTQLVSVLASSLVPVVKAMTPMLAQLAILFGTSMSQQVLILTPILAGLLPPLAQMVAHLIPIVTWVLKVANVLVDWVSSLNGPIARGLGDFLGFVAGFASKLETTLEKAFKVPVNWLILDAYDKGIAKFWNAVVTDIGLVGVPKLPILPGLAGGGIVPGTDHGRDEVVIAARPEEGVLVPGAVRAIGGPRALHALNAAHGGHAGDGAHFGGGGMIGRAGLPSATGGGGGGGGGGIGGGIIDGLVDTAKLIAALATGNATAFTNAADKLISTPAAGTLANVMTALPKAMVTDLGKALVDAWQGSGGGPSGAGLRFGTVSGSVASWFSAAVKAAGVPASWIPGLETIAHYESGDDPDAINLTDANAAAGDPSRGVMQTIGATFSAYHVPGTSMDIFNPVANIAAAARYIEAVYGNPGNTPGLRSLARGGPYLGYDSGGWLPPGLPLNSTGQPEAVLTPQESQALITVARQFAAMGGGTAARTSPAVINNWYGPQMPSQETLAEMDRHNALVFGG